MPRLLHSTTKTKNSSTNIDQSVRQTINEKFECISQYHCFADSSKKVEPK